MLNSVKHIVRRWHSQLRELLRKRSPEWKKLRDEFLKKNPACVACGSKKYLQVHHVQPRHLCPELELDPKNLITLCMAKGEHHLLVGHGGDFNAYNPMVRVDAKLIRLDPKREPTIVKRARTRRRYTN